MICPCCLGPMEFSVDSEETVIWVCLECGYEIEGSPWGENLADYV